VVKDPIEIGACNMIGPILDTPRKSDFQISKAGALDKVFYFGIFPGQNLTVNLIAKPAVNLSLQIFSANNPNCAVFVLFCYKCKTCFREGR
jgi:hypothetical protein